MGKVTVDRIVSLIIEQLNGQNPIDAIFPPDKNTFIDNPLKYPELFEKAEVTNEPEPATARVPEPAEMAETSAPSELNERTNFEYDQETLPQPMRIPIGDLTKGPRTPTIPKIISMDPETNELVEDVVIGDLVLITPSGKRVLAFENYGEEAKVDRTKKHRRYVVLADSRFLADKPRGKEFGKEIPRNVQQTLSVAPEGESEIDRDERIRRLKAIKEGNAKRYGIFPIINDLFSDPELLDHMDICLIPETWGTPIRTEHTSNKIILKKFGGNSPEIDADFIAVRDLQDINGAIDSVMDLRAELAMGEGGERQRETSQHIPRQHANYIYTKGGNWAAKQRVHDENFFKAEGGKTRIYKLMSKNIQEGLKTIDVKSVLYLKGFIQGEDYVLKATFTVELNYRNLETGVGESTGSLIDPIVVGLTKPIPEDVDPGTFTLEQNTDFFVNEGRTTSKGSKTGFLPILLKKLGAEIKTQVDPDVVLQRMSQLIQNAVDQNV